MTRTLRESAPLMRMLRRLSGCRNPVPFAADGSGGTADEEWNGPRLIFGIAGDAIPVGISPTMLTPYFAFSCRSDDSTIPRTSATTGPGIRGLNRAINRIKTIVPAPAPGCRGWFPADCR